MSFMIGRGVGGIILCGGESRRMGRPKAWLPVHGEPLLCRVVRIVGSVVAPVVVVAAVGQALPDVPCRVVRDARPGRGPLEGIAAGLAALEGEAAFVSACDAPFLTAMFILRMATLLGDADIVIPEVGGHRHSLSGVYRRDVLPTLEQLLAENERRPAALFARARTRFVGAADLGDGVEKALRNVNTPEEYLAALREIEPG